MAIDSLWLQNVTYPARHDRLTFDALWTEGILGTSSLEVTPSSPAAMTVRAAVGIAVVQGDDQTNQGKYLIRNDATITGIAIGAAPGSGQRNDLVVLKVNDPNAGGTAGNNATVQVVVGTASASPVDPAVPASALVLARVRVPAGTIAITAGLIDDLRVTSVSPYNVVPAGSITSTQLAASVSGALAPTGAIMSYGGTVAPSGWLLCDGTAYAAATYPALAAVLNNAYDTSGGQASPGAGNFRVPILTGRVPVGRDGADAAFTPVGQFGGASSVILTAAQSGLVAHSHTVSGTGSTDSQNAAHNHAFTTTSGGSHTHTADVRGNSATSHFHYAGGVGDSLAGEPSTTATSLSATSGLINSGGSHSHSGPTATENATHAHSVTSITGTAAAVAAANASSSHTNLQPYLVVNYIIKT